MGKKAVYIHKGVITNSKILFDNVHYWNREKHNFENKRIAITIQDVDDLPTSENQRGYYFGVLLEKYVMQHEQFQGKDIYTVHREVMEVLRTFPQSAVTTDGEEVTINKVDSFSGYSSREAAKYINDVMDYIVLELGFDEPEPPTNFKLNKYKKNEKQ